MGRRAQSSGASSWSRAKKQRTAQGEERGAQILMSRGVFSKERTAMSKGLYHTRTHILHYSSSYLRKLTAFCSKFSRPWSYLITVFGSRCFDIVCTCRYERPLSNARVIAVLRRSCGEKSPSLAQSVYRLTRFYATRTPQLDRKSRTPAGYTAPDMDDRCTPCAQTRPRKICRELRRSAAAKARLVSAGRTADDTIRQRCKGQEGGVLARRRDSKLLSVNVMWRRGWDSNPRWPLDHSGFRVRPNAITQRP